MADELVRIFTNRREFLAAKAASGDAGFVATRGKETWYAIAPTEHKFRVALCGVLFPEIEKLTKDSIMRLMAEELSGTGKEAT